MRLVDYVIICAVALIRSPALQYCSYRIDTSALSSINDMIGKDANISSPTMIILAVNVCDL